MNRIDHELFALRARPILHAMLHRAGGLPSGWLHKPARLSVSTRTIMGYPVCSGSFLAMCTLQSCFFLGIYYFKGFELTYYHTGILPDLRLLHRMGRPSTNWYAGFGFLFYLTITQNGSLVLRCSRSQQMCVVPSDVISQSPVADGCR